MHLREIRTAERLGCPVIDTVSTSASGLKEVVSKAVELVGSIQNAPYSQGNIDLHDKAEVEKADRARFEFVDGIMFLVFYISQAESPIGVGKCFS